MSVTNFADKLIADIEKKNSCLAVGIDPRIDLIPASVKTKASDGGGNALEVSARAIELFGKGLIDAIADIVPAVKLQVAFYERFGWQLWNRTVYVIGEIPHRIEPGLLAIIMSCAIVACLIGALVPSYLAARLRPVETLHGSRT